MAQAFKRSTNPVSLAPCESYAEQVGLKNIFSHLCAKTHAGQIFQEAFLFELTLEIREREDAKKEFDTVPRQKGIFKLRSGAEKKVVVTVRQVSRHNTCALTVERCFGMLVSPGRNVRHADMQLLERVTMATSNTGGPSSSSSEGGSGGPEGGPPDAAAGAHPDGGITHVLTGSWDPSETAFAVLNRETPPDVQSVFVTIAADLVISQVSVRRIGHAVPVPYRMHYVPTVRQL